MVQADAEHGEDYLLSQYGAGDWELVGVVNTGSGHYSTTKFYFKRRKLRFF